MAAGIVWNARNAAADLLARRERPESLRAAMRAMPANGAYAARLADEVFATDPELATSLLEKAVALNPCDAASWIQLGLLHEEGNGLAAAEAAFLRAGAVDNTFLPAWSLANFYFRRQAPPQFWRWARVAAQMAPGDATPLLRLAWYVDPTVAVLEKQLQLQRPGIQSQFLNFLITRGDPQGVSEAARHLLETGTHDTTRTVLGACDWLIGAKQPGLALSLWNELAARQQIAYAALAPATMDSITNGDFARQPLSLGFDWHLTTVNGVSSFFDTTPNALGFEFSGDEPDQFVLLTQAAPVEPQKTYALLVATSASGIAPESGLTWTVKDSRSDALLATTAALSSVPQTTVCFTPLAQTSFVEVSLGYQRRPGTVRPQGKLSLTRVRLAPAAARQCTKNTPDSGPSAPHVEAGFNSEGNRQRALAMAAASPRQDGR